MRKAIVCQWEAAAAGAATHIDVGHRRAGMACTFEFLSWMGRPIQSRDATRSLRRTIWSYGLCEGRNEGREDVRHVKQPTVILEGRE